MNYEEPIFHGPDEGFYNDGVIDGIRPTDYLSGDLNTAPETIKSLDYKVRNESGNWLDYLPSGERQSSRRGDSMSCVTFSALNCIEIQQKFLIGSAQNYSDRWTAKRSNTTPQGNYLWQVADTIRKEGLVPESDYPAPSSYTWAEYHADISEPLASQLTASGKKWLEGWSIGYEWVGLNAESLVTHLKQAPLQGVIPGHAVTIYKYDKDNDLIYYLDSYQPYLKVRARIDFGSALKIVLTKKEQAMTNSVLVKRGSEYGFFDPATSEDGLISQMLNRGITPPQDANGKLIWAEVDKLVRGQVV